VDVRRSEQANRRPTDMQERKEAPEVWEKG
jgi:hypothetical protein